MVSPRTCYLQEWRWSCPVWKLPLPSILNLDRVSSGRSTHIRVWLSTICVTSEFAESSHFFHTLTPKRNWWVIFFLPWTWQAAVWMQRRGGRREEEKAQVFLSLAVVQSHYPPFTHPLKGPQPQTLSQQRECSLLTKPLGFFLINLLS